MKELFLYLLKSLRALKISRDYPFNIQEEYLQYNTAYNKIATQNL